MKKTSLLQKLASVGIATFGAITTTAGLMSIAPSANAAVIGCGTSDLSTSLGVLNTCGDKRINNLTASFGIPGTTDFEFEEVIIDQEYDVAFDFAASGNPLLQGNYELTYTIDIDQTLLDPNHRFSQVSIALAAGVDALTNDFVEFEKDVYYSFENFNNDIPDATLTGRVDAGGTIADPNVFIPGNLEQLWIKDSIEIVGQTAFVNEITNDFIQQDQVNVVPEPGTILGFVAVGVLGLGLRPKKQS